MSSQLQHEVTGFDETVKPDHADYAGSGLKTASLIRLGFLAVLPVENLTGRIGSVSAARHRRLLSRLSDYLLVNKKA